MTDCVTNLTTNQPSHEVTKQMTYQVTNQSPTYQLTNQFTYQVMT